MSSSDLFYPSVLHLFDTMRAAGRPHAGDGVAPAAEDQVGLSSFWRRNTSREEADELAKVLRALRKAAGSLGENVGRIEWAGMSAAQDDAIVLDPELAMGHYPVPAGRFDRLLGLVVQKALRRTEWSERVWQLVHAGGAAPEAEQIALQKLVHCAEQHYLELCAGRNVLGLYAALVRPGYKQPALDGDAGLTLEDTLDAWWLGSDAGREVVATAVGQHGLVALAELAAELRRIAVSAGGVLSRCQRRADLYLATWERMGECLLALPLAERRLLWWPPAATGGGAGVVRQREGIAKGKQLPATLALAVETRLAADSSDLTAVVRDVVGGADEVVPTSLWDCTTAAHPVVDVRTVGRVRAILQTYAARRPLISRGLTAGRLDRRRLYRAATSGKCFLERRTVPVMDWDVCLVIDASGSLRGRRWRVVEDTVATLYQAFRGLESRLYAYAYFESDGVCMVSPLVRGGALCSVPPAGQTASGQALIAAAFMLPEDARPKTMIHVTDGESNFGCGVEWGQRYCADKGIDLITLGVGCRERQAMEAQYGRAIQFLEHYGQLPAALEELLKWTLLHGAGRARRRSGSCVEGAPAAPEESEDDGADSAGAELFAGAG